MSELKNKFKKEILPKLQKKLGIKNPMAAPRLSKIVVNMGVKDAISDKKNIQLAGNALAQITGQKPKVTRAKKSIATFKLRQGDQIGVVVTLRGEMMYDFFGKLIDVVMPRMRDFHGVNEKSFNGHGDYTLGLQEFAVFPEIDQGKVERTQGLEITIVTTAKNDKEAHSLLKELGMPFAKG